MSNEATYKPRVTGAPWLQPGPAAVQTVPQHQFSFKRLVKRLFYFLLAALVAGIAAAGWMLYQDASHLLGNKNPLALASALIPAPLKESNGRVNILLAGYSADDPGH